MPLQLIEEEIELYSQMAEAFRCGADALDCCVDSSLEFLELVNEKLQQHGYKVGVDYGVCQDVEAPSWHQTFFFLNYKIDFTVFVRGSPAHKGRGGIEQIFVV